MIMPPRILRSAADLDSYDIYRLYAGFDTSITVLDCGKMCALHNSSGKPFCCDVCHAVPAAYSSEWNALKDVTTLWHPWRADECPGDDATTSSLASLEAETPPGMRLLACLGPNTCQRFYRLFSCRQFPFFPYVTSDYRFLGLAYDWEFEQTCWVISHLGEVTRKYREQFVRTYDQLFAWFQDEFDSYANRSELMRAYFAGQKRRIPVLHRDGGFYLLTSVSERIRKVDPTNLPRFGLYPETPHS
jgi:hypothetical protein